jgi:endothelin-converting enzyme/putative endopeptidase
MRIRALTIPAAILSITAVACTPEPQAPAAMPTMEASPATVVAPTYAQGPGIDRSAIDEGTGACADFYQHACGAWLKNTPIPDDKAGWTRSFSVIDKQNKELLNAILTDLVAGKTEGVAFGKEMASMYGACMNEAAIDKAGAKPLAPLFATVKKLSKKNLAETLAVLHAQGVGGFFSFGPTPDAKDSSQMIGDLVQGGIGLPERDYYFDDDAKTKELQGAYKKYLETLFTLSGKKPAAAKALAEDVYGLEKRLAEYMMNKVDRRDPQKVTNKMDLAKVEALAPGFAWKTYLKAMKVSDAVAINVSMVDYLKALPERFDKEPLPLVKSYLEARILTSTATQLAKPFDDAAFAYKQALTGQKSQEVRWKRCVGLVNHGMGEALARPFIAKTLGEGGKDAVQQLIMSIEASMEARLPELAWMDDETRAKAFEKVRAIVNKVVQPSKWRNYEGLTAKAGDHFGNVLAAEAFENARQMAKVGKAVDREEWFMSPPDVNAYYDPQTNQMVFPAGILQPPFYAPQNAKSANLGGIGMVMGHELTHGFDDEGRQFDAKGFDERAQCVVAQYNDFIPIDDLHVNGKLTLGENLADLGGINLAYQAMMKDAEASKTGSAGFTPQQTFFYAYAQAWCTNQRPEMQRLRVKTDPHSPPKFRVNGPLSNMPEFRQAFACKTGDAMVRENSCRVW